MISKYVFAEKLKKDLYAVFNSLVCNPIYVDKEEKERIFNNDLSLFSHEEIEKMKELGIIIETEEDDKQVFSLVKKTIKDNLKNKIFLMYIIPTNSCNLACTYCFIGKTACGNNVKFMDSATVLNAVDKYAEHMKSNSLEKGEIIFYGGEPTICWDKIVEAKKHILKNNYNIEVTMVTNGALIDEKKIEDIKTYRLGVGLSVDGPKHITDKNRLFKDSNKSVYDVVLEKINLLKKHNVFFSLSVTISDYFIENSKEALDWLVKLAVPSINFNLMRFTEKGADWKNYYKHASKFLIKAYEVLKQNNIQDDRVQRKVESFYERQFKFSDCAAMGGNQLTVRPNGDVCVCHGYWNTDRDTCGNININSFEEILGSESYQEWSNNISINRPKCRKCKYLYACGGGCAQQSEILFGGRFAVDKSFCLYTKATFRWILLNHYYQNS